MRFIVNNGLRRIQTLLDVRGLRLAAGAGIAALIWFALLARIVPQMSSTMTPPEPVTAPPLDMQIVTLATPSSETSSPVQASRAPRPSAAKPASRSVPKPEGKPVTNAAVVHETRPADLVENSHSTDTAVIKAPTPANDDSRANEPSSTHQRAEGTGPTLAARALSQPLPTVPDDLRETAYRAEALARFSVHADGTVDVELLKPTPYPRLNQILLEALAHWRFFPAMENGHPVESRQDVRVHFNVS